MGTRMENARRFAVVVCVVLIGYMTMRIVRRVMASREGDGASVPVAPTASDAPNAKSEASGFVLSGRVLDELDRSAGNVLVTAESATNVVTGKTNSAGQFALVVPAGVYRIDARMGPRAGVLAETVTVPVSDTASADGGVGVLRVIRLGRGLMLAGTVKTATLQPLPDAGVKVAKHGLGSAPRPVDEPQETGLDGRYRFVGLWPGRYTVTVTVGKTTQRLEVDLADTKSDADVVLR